MCFIPRRPPKSTRLRANCNLVLKRAPMRKTTKSPSISTVIRLPATSPISSPLRSPALRADRNRTTSRGLPLGREGRSECAAPAPGSRTGMIELYQAEWCPYSSRVRQRFTELGVAFVARQVPAGRADREEMRRQTGSDEIPPLLLEGGTPVTRGAQDLLAHPDAPLRQGARARGPP